MGFDDNGFNNMNEDQVPGNQAFFDDMPDPRLDDENIVDVYGPMQFDDMTDHRLDDENVEYVYGPVQFEDDEDEYYQNAIDDIDKVDKDWDFECRKQLRSISTRDCQEWQENVNNYLQKANQILRIHDVEYWLDRSDIMVDDAKDLERYLKFKLKTNEDNSSQVRSRVTIEYERDYKTGEVVYVYSKQNNRVDLRVQSNHFISNVPYDKIYSRNGIKLILKRGDGIYDQHFTWLRVANLDIQPADMASLILAIQEQYVTSYFWRQLDTSNTTKIIANTIEKSSLDKNRIEYARITVKVNSLNGESDIHYLLQGISKFYDMFE